MQPTADWGPKLQLHRMETHSPKHTDSQVPLAGQFEDCESNSSDDLKTPIKGHRDGRFNILADEPSDSDSGLRLKMPGHYGETPF